MTSHAVWLCACVSVNRTPSWLVHAVDEDGISWQRIPAGLSASDIVEAEHLTGCHLAPEDVLAWLRGEGELGDEDDEDPSIYEELRRRIRLA